MYFFRNINVYVIRIIFKNSCFLIQKYKMKNHVIFFTLHLSWVYLMLSTAIISVVFILALKKSLKLN